MPEEPPIPSPLNQGVERDVRLLIGDLHMQLIVLRNMLNLAQNPPAEPLQPEVRINGGAGARM
jgi:hypothetical protein